jgi:hypothetical protein
MIAQLLKQLAKLNPLQTTLLLNQFSKILAESPELLAPLTEAISDGQMSSKQWLADELCKRKLGTVFLCGGWYALLLLDDRLIYDKCISFDLDPSCKKPADTIHRHLLMNGWKFLSTTKDILDINYEIEPLTVYRYNGTTIDITVSPDTIINTSCEHIERFKEWWDMIPNGKLVALQSNNGFDIPGHVNCSESLEDFASITPMAYVLYQGEKEMPKFMRYMRIGYK